MSNRVSLGQCLKREMKKQGIKVPELARAAGVKTSFLYDVLSGKSANPSTITLAKVARHLGVDLMQMAAGKSEESTLISLTIPQDYIKIPGVMVDTIEGGVTLAAIADEQAAQLFSRPWIESELNANPRDIRVFLLRGDSMEPTLSHNDRLLVDISKKSPAPVGLFLVYEGFGLSVRRLEYTQDKPPRIRFIADNPQYNSYERSSADAVIIGRIVWASRAI